MEQHLDVLAAVSSQALERVQERPIDRVHGTREHHAAEQRDLACGGHLAAVLTPQPCDERVLRQVDGRHVAAGCAVRSQGLDGAAQVRDRDPKLRHGLGKRVKHSRHRMHVLVAIHAHRALHLGKCGKVTLDLRDALALELLAERPALRTHRQFPEADEIVGERAALVNQQGHFRNRRARTALDQVEVQRHGKLAGFHVGPRHLGGRLEGGAVREDADRRQRALAAANLRQLKDVGGLLFGDAVVVRMERDAHNAPLTLSTCGCENPRVAPGFFYAGYSRLCMQC